MSFWEHKLAGQEDRREYNEAAGLASSLTGAAPAWAGNNQPYYAQTAERAYELPRQQTLLHYGIRRQAEQAAAEQAARWANMALAQDKMGLDREQQLWERGRMDRQLNQQDRRLDQGEQEAAWMNDYRTGALEEQAADREQRERQLADASERGWAGLESRDQERLAKGEERLAKQGKVKLNDDIITGWLEDAGMGESDLFEDDGDGKVRNTPKHDAALRRAYALQVKNPELGLDEIMGEVGRKVFGGGEGGAGKAAPAWDVDVNKTAVDAAQKTMSDEEFQRQQAKYVVPKTGAGYPSMAAAEAAGAFDSELPKAKDVRAQQRAAWEGPDRTVGRVNGVERSFKREGSPSSPGVAPRQGGSERVPVESALEGGNANGFEPGYKLGTYRGVYGRFYPDGTFEPLR